jgi:hypothetical protein
MMVAFERKYIERLICYCSGGVRVAIKDIGSSVLYLVMVGGKKNSAK